LPGLFYAHLARKPAKIVKSCLYLYPNHNLNRCISDERSFYQVGLMEDKKLLAECKQGDKQALRRIYEKYRDYLLILAIALSNDAHLAEDAVHDTFVAFAGSVKEFELTGSLKGYLATCVANRVRDIIKSRQHRQVSLEQNCSIDSQFIEPSCRLICNEQLQQLSRALAQLSHEQREVISLRIHGQMRFRAIARFLCISVNTAKGRFRYGINKLRSIMNDEVQK